MTTVKVHCNLCTLGELQSKHNLEQLRLGVGPEDDCSKNYTFGFTWCKAPCLGDSLILTLTLGHCHFINEERLI